MKTLKIFRKQEWITLWRKPFLIGGGILFYISLFFALGNGWQSVNTTVGEQREIAAATAERSEELRMSFATGDGLSLTPYDVGGKLAKRYIFKEPTPFAFLSIGQQELFASEYSISLRDTDFSILNGGGEVGNPLINYLGAFDFTFVIIWLLPLLIILYMYDVVSGERESGTLALLLSQPLSLSRLLWLKLVVKFGFIAIYLLVGMLIGFGIFGWEVFTETGSLLILLGGILLYCLFWFGLSVLINQLRMSSMANLSMLFLGWLLFVLLIPTSLGLVSDSRYAVPSRLQLVNDLKTSTKEIDNDASRLLDSFYFDHPELAPEGLERSMASYVYKNALKRKMVYEAAHPVVEEYYAGLKEQGSFMERWQYFSPSLMLSNLIEASAENRLVDVTAFQQEADAARAEWHTIFEPKIFKDEPLSKAEVEALPSFEYEGRGSFGFGLLVILGLIGVNLLVFCGVVVIGP